MLGAAARAHRADGSALYIRDRQDQALADADVLRAQAIGLNDGLLRDMPSARNARKRIALAHAVGDATPGGERREAKLCIGRLRRNVRLLVGIGAHEDRGIGQYAPPLGDAVDVAKLVLGHAGRLGHGSERFAVLQLVGGPARKRLAAVHPACEIVDELVDLVCGKQHHIVVRGHDHRQLEARIELSELLEGHAGKLGRRLGVDVARLRHGDEEGLVAHVGQLHAVPGRVGHNALDGLELGHVVGRFIGHAQMLVIRRALSRLLAANGALHASFAPIVGGERQMPVVEHAVEIFEIVECGASAFKHVAPVVAPEILLERIVRARRRHELPEACGLGARERFGLEGAFDKRQQRQLRRHAAVFDLFENVIEIAPRALEHAVQIVRPTAIMIEPPVNPVAFQGRHRISAPDAVPDVCGRP